MGLKTLHILFLFHLFSEQNSSSYSLPKDFFSKLVRFNFYSKTFCLVLFLFPFFFICFYIESLNFSQSNELMVTFLVLLSTFTFLFSPHIHQSKQSLGSIKGNGSRRAQCSSCFFKRSLRIIRCSG